MSALTLVAWLNTPPEPRGVRSRSRGTGRRGHVQALAGVLLFAMAVAAPARALTPPAPAPAAVPPARAAVPAGPQTRPAQTAPAAPAKGKVWTDADLERLRDENKGRLTFTSEDASGYDESFAEAPRQPTDGALIARYEELVTQANAELARLARERLAASNPFLRGTARDAQGNPTAARPTAVIDGEVARWNMRKTAAQAQIDLRRPNKQP